MRILVCPDSFKGTLSSVRVAQLIKEELIGYDCVSVPISDGGEGTVDTLLYGLGGEKKIIKSHDPIGREIDAYYGINGNQAYIEMAQTSGLCRLSPDEYNPLITTTYGVGEMIGDAVSKECIKEIYIGIGGSATNDIGVGMAQALGAKFFDQRGEEIKGFCGVLPKIYDMDVSNISIRDKSIKVFCDVCNPLYGKDGASRVYAKQKGADNEMIDSLERNVKRFADIVYKKYGLDINFDGGGAAGGLGAGLKFFLNAEILSGIDGIIDFLQLEDKIKRSDIVIVGEGQMDYQTLFGKAPSGIAKLAKKLNKKVIAIVGKIGKDVRDNFKYIDHIFSCYSEKDIKLSEIKKHSEGRLRLLLKEVRDKIPSIDLYKNQLTVLS